MSEQFFRPLTEKRPPPTAQEQEDFINAKTCSKCICENVSFADILAHHKATGDSLEKIMADTKIGTDCGVCVPYMRKCLETGVVEQPIELTATEMWEPSKAQGVPKEDLSKEGLIAKPLNTDKTLY